MYGEIAKTVLKIENSLILLEIQKKFQLLI